MVPPAPATLEEAAPAVRGGDCVNEVCDGADNDFDGRGTRCECLPGDTEACYIGLDGTQGVGPCKAGKRTGDPATPNKFGPCTGEVVPATETGDDVDQDCNGTADDGLPDPRRGVGACMRLVPACVGGQPGTCVLGQPQTGGL